MHGVVVSPWGGVVVVLALADVRSLLGGFAMQSTQRFVRQPPLPLDDFFYVMVPGLSLIHI